MEVMPLAVLLIVRGSPAKYDQLVIGDNHRILIAGSGKNVQKIFIYD